MPLCDEDYEAKKKLKNGEVYEAEIKLVRNYKFHKKFFALISAGYSLLPERTQNGFRSTEGFRAYCIVAAGFYELYYNPRLKEFVEIPKSLKFSSMDNAEFEEVYERVKDVIFGLLGSRITEEQFNTILSNF
jgi:hypothetical protein